MKYVILRAMDIAGLKVLEPIVRLACGEEPLVQARKIVLFICVPVLTFVAFLAAWSYIGPRHKTKSGEVPGPLTVLDAWNGIVKFAKRENTKSEDYIRSGAERELLRKQVQSDLAQVDKYAIASRQRFEQLDTKRTEVLDDVLSKYQAALETKQREYVLNSKAREAQLIERAKVVRCGERSAKSEFLTLIQQHFDISEKEGNHLKAMRSEIDARRREKWPVLEKERNRKNSLDETKQFLQKRVAFLSSANRSVKVENAKTKLDNIKRDFLHASTPEELLSTGKRVVIENERLQKIADSEYARPPTFFMQLRTSLACVFAGFLIATAIAIPLGVLCGLSDVCMAAFTPLISLFKPVSPIVWLPIVFIIVGGFQLPEITGRWAWLFAPSFLASAITVALCSLWPTLVNTALGVASIDQDHINVARVLRLGFWNRLFKIVIPSALPLIFTGLRISLGVGWMVLIAAELLSSSPGLGKFVWDMFNNGSSETFSQMFVVVFVVGVVGLLLDRIMIVFQRLVSFDGAPTAL